eukprot:9095182-Alexandrium_andersonii.AAC.1
MGLRLGRAADRPCRMASGREQMGRSRSFGKLAPGTHRRGGEARLDAALILHVPASSWVLDSRAGIPHRCSLRDHGVAHGTRGP